MLFRSHFERRHLDASEILQSGKSWGWGRISTIKRDGCYIETMHPLPVGTEAKLRLTDCRYFNGYMCKRSFHRSNVRYGNELRAHRAVGQAYTVCRPPAPCAGCDRVQKNRKRHRCRHGSGRAPPKQLIQLSGEQRRVEIKCHESSCSIIGLLRLAFT